MIEDTALLAPPLPLDADARQRLAEFLAGAAAAGIRAFDGELDRSILFAVVARRSEALAPPGITTVHGGRAHTITINALAASLARPFETIRRHVNAMLDVGLLARGPRGIFVPDGVVSRPVIASLLATQHDQFVRLVEKMAASGIALPAPRALPYDPSAGTVAALDALLDAVEFGAAHYGCWLEMVILATVVCANDLAAEDDPVPVTIVAIARTLAMPYSTIRRHAEAMLHEGALLRRRGGVIAAEAWLAQPALAVDSRTHADHVRRILTRLASAGFPFNAPARAYLTGRPAPLIFTSHDDREDAR